MTIKIRFPNNEEIEVESGTSMVLLGANGSGKTRFGAKIEELNDGKYSKGNGTQELLVHRISAQKSLTISESISTRDLESSEKALYIGATTEYANKLTNRFNQNPVTGLLNDYDNALSLLFAEGNAQLQKSHEEDVKAVEQGTERPDPITTVIDKATKLWNELLPHRKIDLSGNGVHIEFDNQRYHGKEMSDGERVILYMICQVLVLKPDSILIIDEPEQHIHKAIINKLWDMLEAARQDCVFIYITHDLEFALSRNSERVLWIKSYDGSKWDYELLDVNDFSDLPGDLLYEVIGTREKILFIEGKKDSYDYLLYQEIFRDRGYHVIPCGGCQDVVKAVKSKRAYEKLNKIIVCGIIDRDFRTEAEIAQLKKDNIFCLDVAEVENLFVVPELLRLMAEQLGCDEATVVDAEKFIQELFEKNINNQINTAFIKEVNHQLTLKNFSDEKLTPNEIKKHLDTDFSIEKITEFYDEKKKQFNSAETTKEILRIFNFKDLSKKIGSKFGLRNNDYPKRVINFLKKDTNNLREQIISILLQYIPELPS